MNIIDIEREYVILRDKYLHWECVYIDNNDNNQAKMLSNKYRELAHTAKKQIHRYADF